MRGRCRMIRDGERGLKFAGELKTPPAFAKRDSHGAGDRVPLLPSPAPALFWGGRGRLLQISQTFEQAACRKMIP